MERIGHLCSTRNCCRFNARNWCELLKISLSDVFVRSAEAGLELLSSNGSMPAGHNGPWNIPETPVRNTAHWAMTFYKAYDVSGEDRYLRAAISTCDYLLKRQARPSGKAFHCLHSFDQCNGLIGQAWALEPLIFLGHQLNNQEYLKSSREILLLHKYEEDLHLWRNMNLDGKPMDINATFNQQLWFATSHLILGKILQDKTLIDRGRNFFRHLVHYISFLGPGLIQHTISQQNLHETQPISFLKRFYREGPRYAPRLLSDLKLRNQIRELSIGYQPFVLYGFAKAYEVSKEECWWRNPWLKNVLQKMLILVQSESYFKELSESRYAWTYNPVGLEIAYALSVFQDVMNVNCSVKSIKWWIEHQLKDHWDPSSGLMERNTAHPKTLSARLYEGTPLQDIRLHLNLSR